MNGKNTYAAKSKVALRLYEKLQNSTKKMTQSATQTYGKAINVMNKEAKKHHVIGGIGYNLTQDLLTQYSNWKLTLSNNANSSQYIKKHNKDSVYSSLKSADIYLITELAGNLPISEHKMQAFLVEREGYIISHLLLKIEETITKMKNHPHEKISLAGNILYLVFLEENEMSVDEISESLQISRRTYFTERQRAIQMLSAYIFGSNEDVFYDNFSVKNGIISLPELKRDMRHIKPRNKVPEITPQEYVSLQEDCILKVEECLNLCVTYHSSKKIEGKAKHGDGYKITRTQLVKYRQSKMMLLCPTSIIEKEMISSKIDPNSSFLSDGTPISDNDLLIYEDDYFDMTQEYYGGLSQAQAYYDITWGESPIERYSKTAKCYLTAAACAIIELKIDNIRKSENKRQRMLGEIAHRLFLADDGLHETLAPQTERMKIISDEFSLKERQLYHYQNDAISLMSMMMTGLEPGSLGLLGEENYKIIDDTIYPKLDKKP